MRPLPKKLHLQTQTHTSAAHLCALEPVCTRQNPLLTVMLLETGRPQRTATGPLQTFTITMAQNVASANPLDFAILASELQSGPPLLLETAGVQHEIQWSHTQAQVPLPLPVPYATEMAVLLVVVCLVAP